MSTSVVENEAREQIPKTRPFFSEILWGNWSHDLPQTLANTTTLLRRSTYDDAGRYLQSLGSAVYGGDGSDNRFLPNPFSETKSRYYREVGDFFSVFDGSNRTGIFVGTPIDWSTYYLRFAYVDGAHRGKGTMRLILSYVMGKLQKMGVERFEADVSPGNANCLAMLHKLGFQVTGFSVSERWGAAVKLTKMVHPSGPTIFARQFCAGHS